MIVLAWAVIVIAALGFSAVAIDQMGLVEFLTCLGLVAFMFLLVWAVNTVAR